MIDKIQQAIECWVSRPTWFSPHPSDAKELKKAISNLKQLDFTPSTDELHEVILNKVKDLPKVLGTPSDLDAASRDLAVKVSAKL